MYTVEYEADEVCITILDDDGFNEDLVINSFTDIVYIRQYDEATDRITTIAISPHMWEELINAIHSPEGAFRIAKS